MRPAAGAADSHDDAPAPGGSPLRDHCLTYAVGMTPEPPPLEGVRVLELAGLGPAPFAAMLLADLGADALTVRRPGEGDHLGGLSRGRPFVEADLKDPAARGAVLELVGRADVLLEGFRPGVMERLGLGPDECLSLNPRLVYVRLTGWGQTGDRAMTAGHDLTYIAVSGALHLAARAGQRPAMPANLLGDFAGGSLTAVTALLAALMARERTGRGRVLDVAMTDGASYLASMQHGLRAQGMWSDAAGESLLDGGAPFYDVYECADGRWLAVAPLEPQFFAALVELLELDPSWNQRRDDRVQWPELRADIAAAVRARTRDEWDELASGTDACVAGVLDLGEARVALADRFWQPAGAPGPVPLLPFAPSDRGDSASDALRRWGVDGTAVGTLTGSSPG